MSDASLLYLTMKWSGTIGVTLFVTAYLFLTRYRKGLGDIPGPFLASRIALGPDTFRSWRVSIRRPSCIS